MTELNQLVINYKRTKNKQILGKVFVLLEKQIKEKAKFIYYQKKYVKKTRNRKLQIRLKDLKIIDFMDVLQDLNLYILKIIENYHVKKPFENYLYASLWDYRPTFLNSNFIQSTSNIGESEIIGEEGIEYFEDMLIVEPAEIEEDIHLPEMFNNLDEEEKNLIKIILKYPRLKQAKMAKIARLTQQKVSEILTRLRSKYNYFR